LQALAQDPVLSRLKLIAEPWDIGPGGWQTGHFPPPFAEWNDRYRDHARRFWRGDAGMLGNLATRLAGSADLFRGRSVAQSINFITAHDGFTLADLVSYERKHNEANGEQNRDGTDDNLSWNNGTEGETTDPVILAARKRDQAALLATLLLSRGTPMLSQGAELGASQGGNNNAYPQDNEITWLDWAHADADLIALTSRLSHFRAAHPWAWQGSELHGDGALYPEVSWCGADGNPLSDAGWNDAAADLLIMVRTQQTGEERIALIFHRGLSFRLVTLPPARPGRGWKLAVSTAEGSDIKSNRVSCPARAVIALVEHASSRRDQAPDDGFLARVAAAADIGTEWWEVNGTHHRVCAATHRTLLEGMGFPASTRSDAEASLHRLSAARPLPVSFAARVGRRAQFPLALSQGADPSPLCLSLSNEAGRTTPLAILPNNGTITECTAPDGTRHRQWRIDLPALPPGRYRLEHESTACALTIAPETCYQPLTNRVIGLTAQLYSLRRPGDQGIGDFTSLAQAAGFAARNGAAILGINPLHARFLNQPDRASPYHPSDRRFLDPMMIDLAAPDPGLDCEQVRALLAQHAPQIAALEAAPMIDHARVATLKTKVLRAARRSSSAFAAFTSQALSALRDFAVFQAISEFHPGPWQQWPVALRDRDPAALAAFAAAHGDAIEFHLYLQFLAERGLARAAQAGLAVGLLRDLAVGAAGDGAEIWANPGLYVSSASIGAPPDPLGPQGQIWALPPPNPHVAVQTGHKAFIELIQANMRHAGGLRIDHILGLRRLFWVPNGAKASEGAYVTMPMEQFFAELALESHRAQCLVIGEDLGTVAPGLREAMQDHAILRNRMLLLDYEHGAFPPAASYPVLCATAVSSHDLPTLAGWRQAADITERETLGLFDPTTAARERAARTDAIKALANAAHGDSPEAVHAFVASTPSLIATAQIEDLAGETVSVNLPGTDQERPNWRRRMAVGIEKIPTRVIEAMRKVRG
jgi:glycogen operon protein